MLRWKTGDKAWAVRIDGKVLQFSVGRVRDGYVEVMAGDEALYMRESWIHRTRGAALASKIARPQ